MSFVASHSSGDTAALLITVTAVGTALSVVLVAAMWRVFTRAGDHGWAAVVPVYNLWTMLRIARKPRWWLVLYVVPIANIVVAVLVARAVARGFGRGRWTTVGMILLPWIFWPTIAYGSAQWRSPEDPEVSLRGDTRDNRPWLVAVVAAVAFGALAAVWTSVPSGESRDVGGLSAEESSAVAAAGTIAANLATFSRAHFADDFSRALNSTTGSLRSDLSSKRSLTQQTITAGKFDLYAKVQRRALVGPVEPNGSKTQIEGFVVLIALNGYTTKAPATPNPQNLKVTVERIKGTWLASDVSYIGVQA